MRRRFAVLLAVAFASIFGASACGGAEEEMQQRVEEEVQDAQQQVQEATRQIEQEAQEAEQRVEQEAPQEMQKQVEEKIGEEQ